MINLGKAISGWEYILLALSVASGAMVYGFLFIVQATSCFWTVESVEVFNILTYGGTELLSHPLDIYSDWMRRFFLFVLPMAFINYVPAALILDKPIAQGIPPKRHGCRPLVGPVLLLVGWRIWRFGVRHYQSTGS